MADQLSADKAGHDADKAQKEKKREKKRLDEGLEDSFPASDPPAITQPQKNTPAKGHD